MTGQAREEEEEESEYLRINQNILGMSQNIKELFGTSEIAVRAKQKEAGPIGMS